MDLSFSTHRKEKLQRWFSPLVELQRAKEENENGIEEASKGEGEDAAWGW